MGWLKRWGWLWPVATVAFMVPFGADPVMVYMIGWEYPVPWIFSIGILIGCLEQMYWYWLFGWTQAHIKEISAIRSVIEDAVWNFNIAGLPEEFRHVWGQVKSIFHTLWSIFLDMVSDRLNISDPNRQKFLDVLIRLIKNTSRAVSYGLIFGVGTIPMIGGALGIVICRALPWRWTFLALLMGNTAKVAVIAWMLISFMPPFIAKLCLLGYGLFLVGALMYLVRKQRKFKNRP